MSARAPLAGREAYPHWRTIPTRWSDNDVYGHVNNTVYYQWFDTVVNDWLIERGLLRIGDNGGSGGPIGLVVETGCRYAAPLAYPQPVDVGLGLERCGTSSVAYRLGVFAQGEAWAAAEGRFTHVYVGVADRRPMALPAAWRDAIETLRASGGGQP